MKDGETHIKEIKELVKNFRDARDWKKFHSPKDLAIAINIEAAELLEHFLWRNHPEVQEYLKKSKNKKEVEEELADILIYCLSLSDVIGVEVAAIVKEKLKKNAEKYPVELVKGDTHPEPKQTT